MKEKNEDIIIYHQKKRRKHKIKLAIATGVFIVIGIILIGIYLGSNKQSYIGYKEKSNVDYRVNLIENEFYNGNYLNEGIDIISNLIKDINVEFKYNLDLSEDIEYTYNYRIMLKTQAKEKSKTNSFYEIEQELLNRSQQEGKTKKLVISEKINLDYNKYNDEIKNLIESYKLANTTSDLELGLYLNVTNKATGEQINKESKVMSVQMPLATKTVEVTVNEKDDQGTMTIKENKLENSEYILIAGVVSLIIGLIILVMLIKYILDTRSAEKMYEDELKKILFDYKSYVQKINNELNYKEYKIIKIDTFRELIEMREEIQSPIFMYIEEEIRRTKFMMINGNLLFMNTLEANEIRKRLIEKSKQRKERKHEKNK